jgi:3-oxoacid CoA-transferase
VTVKPSPTIAETGEIPPGQVDLPGVFVTRVVRSTTQMDVQNLPMRVNRPATSARSYHGKPALSREQIGRRVAALLPDESVVNLGAGLPTLVANFIEQRPIILHSENGLLNYGEFVRDDSFDPDLHDAGGYFVTLRPGASFFDSVTSFEIARSGRLDAVVLGGYQVSRNGDLASWSVPGMTGGGIRGAMDLAVGARQVIAMLEHTDSSGALKLVEACDFEITAPGCVDVIVTDLALLRRAGGGFRIDEIARGFTAAEVTAVTGMTVSVTGDPAIMQDAW